MRKPTGKGGDGNGKEQSLKQRGKCNSFVKHLQGELLEPKSGKLGFKSVGVELKTCS